MRLPISELKEMTKTAIRVWLKGNHANEKACCFKFVNNEIFDELVEEVKKEEEAARLQPLLFNKE